MSGYLGDDGHTYADPCTARSGRSKRRWATEAAAVYVVALCARGDDAIIERPTHLFSYRCPKCEGWHIARCRNAVDEVRHLADIAHAEQIIHAPSRRG